MKKLTVIIGDKCNGEVQVKVTQDDQNTVYTLPVGVELTVSDAVAEAVVRQHHCLVGYYEADESAVQSLPVDTIADGSYCFCLQTGSVKFLSDGAWR